LVQRYVKVEQHIERRYTSREDYPKTFYFRRKPKKEGYPSISIFEGSQGEDKEREIEKNKQKFCYLELNHILITFYLP